MRMVLDTNVLLSAAFYPGVCAKLLGHCLLTPSIQIVLSDHILREFVEHGTGKLKGPVDQIEAFVAELRQYSVIVQPDTIPPYVFQDSDDLLVLGTAIAGQAETIVTGDKALLSLGNYQGVSICSPRAIYDRLYLNRS